MDRQDIDALLVSALYGELTPADEARLTAHLESHPADRGALDDLKSARAKVRESRIFDRQAEPPQHISALLLQEAHRRAPKKVVADDGERRDSWFWRFARSFALHPAMAAAAMLVVVLGVSALVYKNKGADFAKRDYSAPTATQPSAMDDRAEMAPEAIVTGADQGAAEQGTAAGSATPADSYHAGLADKDDLSNDPTGVAEGRTKAADNNETAAERWRSDTDGKGAKPTPAKNKGITVTTEQPQPRDLETESDIARNAATEAKLAKEQQDSQRQTARKADSNAALDFTGAGDGYRPSTGTASGVAPGRGATGGGGAANGIVVGSATAPAPTTTVPPKGNAAGPTAAPTTPSANRPYAQPPPPPSTDKATTTATVTAKAPAKQEAKPDTKTAGASAPTGGTASGTKTGSSTSTTDAKKVATQKPAADKPAEKTAEKAPPKDAIKAPPPAQQAPAAPPADPTIAWAKGQHARAVTLAKGGNCTGAAQVALAVSQKAPAYYASFMASDRELKSCKAYIDDARDREAEKSAKSRAQKRVNADEAPAPAESAK